MASRSLRPEASARRAKRRERLQNGGDQGAPIGAMAQDDDAAA